MEYYSVIKKYEIMPFAATWLDLEIIILSGVSQRQISHIITYMWNLKNNTNELNYQMKQTHRCRKQIYGYKTGRGRKG